MALLGCLSFGIASGSEAPTVIDYRELAAGRVVLRGALGVPLGTMVTADAEVIAEPTMPLGAPSGPYYRLRIHAVNGVPLADKPELAFDMRVANFHEINGSLVTTPSGLLSDRDRPREAPEFDLALRRKLDERYVGTRHTVMVHEEASFDGEPANRPGPVGTMMCGGHRFQFGTRLVVSAEDLRTRLVFPRWRETLVEIDQRPLPAAPGERAEFLRRGFDGYLAAGITADPADAARQFRDAAITVARARGLDAASLARCLDAFERRPLPPGVDARVLAGAFWKDGADPAWIIVANGFRSAATLPDQERIPLHGAVGWSTVVSDEVAMLRAADAALLVEAPVVPRSAVGEAPDRAL